jgi:hypothetical protein
MTDQEKTARFLEAIKALNSDSTLMSLDRYEPDLDGRQNECFANCKRKVSRQGGAMQCGWIFAGHSEYDYVVASAHAVWRSPEGVLIDITPRLPFDNLPKTVVLPLRGTEGHLLFLPDEKAFERPNKFLPLSKNKALVRACRLCNRKEWQLWQSPEANAKRVEKMQKSLGVVQPQDGSGS